MKILNKNIILSIAGILTIFSSITSCKKLDDISNPNTSTVESFWVSEENAIKGTNAIYASLQRVGTYRRWMYFVTDGRSDLAMSTSPWTDLSNISKFKFTDYNFVVNYEMWQDHYRGIFRANQVLEYVPTIEMDEELKASLLGEAKFLRALFYYNLVNLYGNVPLATELNKGEEQLRGYPQMGIDAVWTLIEEDLNYAVGVLPESHQSSETGRATMWSAKALLGKALMQQRKFDEALPVLENIVKQGPFSLVADFEDNFRHDTENNEESIFEVQFSDQYIDESDQDGSATSSLGSNRARFFSPVGWSDAEATEWYVNKFISLGDPRLDVTYVYPTAKRKYYGMNYYDLPRPSDRKSNWLNKYLRSYDAVKGDNTIPYRNVDEERDNDSPINNRLIRLADIKLLYAEALHHEGNDPDALQQVQDVRDRVGAGTSPFTAEGVAKVIEWERILELSGESQRFFDMMRYGYFDGTGGAEFDIVKIKIRDPEFNSINLITKGYLPIPTRELDLNEGIEQNLGW